MRCAPTLAGTTTRRPGRDACACLDQRGGRGLGGLHGGCQGENFQNLGTGVPGDSWFGLRLGVFVGCAGHAYGRVCSWYLPASSVLATLMSEHSGRACSFGRTVP